MAENNHATKSQLVTMGCPTKLLFLYDDTPIPRPIAPPDRSTDQMTDRQTDRQTKRQAIWARWITFAGLPLGH